MKIDKSLISGSTTLLILSLLSREELYGYQMITELSRRSDHTFELKEGSPVKADALIRTYLGQRKGVSGRVWVRDEF